RDLQQRVHVPEAGLRVRDGPRAHGCHFHPRIHPDPGPYWRPGMRAAAIRPRPLRWVLVACMSMLGLSAIIPILFMLQAAFRTQTDWAAAKIGLPTTITLDAFSRAWVQA